MRYLLMHKGIETAIIEFSEDGELISLFEILQSAHLLLEIKRDNSYASEWWKNRAIPKSRNKLPNKSPSQWLFDNLGFLCRIAIGLSLYPHHGIGLRLTYM